MANTKELKKRLKSIQGIEKITQAMKMVATARVKKFQALALDGTPYSELLQEFIGDLAANSMDALSPLFQKKDTNNKALYVVMGADGGMCGSFNASVMNKANERIKKRLSQGHKVKVICIGKKCKQFFEAIEKREKNLQIVDSLTEYGANINEAKIYELAGKARDMFLKGEVDVVRIVYAKYKNAMSQVPVALNFLPVDKYDNRLVKQKSDFVKEGERDYTGQIFNNEVGGMLHHQVIKKANVTFEPSVEAIIEALIPRYLNNVFYHAVIESMASEFGAKMTAMTAANQNAQDVIEDLSREFNKIRQTGITNQLIDIVNGGNAQN